MRDGHDVARVRRSLWEGAGNFLLISRIPMQFEAGSFSDFPTSARRFFGSSVVAVIDPLSVYGEDQIGVREDREKFGRAVDPHDIQVRRPRKWRVGHIDNR